MTDVRCPANPKDSSRESAWVLRMLRGPFPGKVWPVRDSVVAVGRGVGCHVRVNDPHVSRNQCELICDGTGLRIRHRSERTPTLVNGLETLEANLKAGDVVNFAGVSFAVECASETVGEPAPMDAHTTQRFGDAVHLQREFDEARYFEKPQLTRDLHHLFTLMRRLGREESLDSLIASMKSHISERVVTRDVWVAWRVGVTEALALYPAASTEEMSRAPFSILRNACESGLGVGGDVTEGNQRLAAIAAPLMHAGQPIGAVAACREPGGTPFDDEDLLYLVAVAECVAPLIRAAERLEQLQRDAAVPSFGSKGTSMLGSSNAMRGVLDDLRRAAVARAHVVLLGETGVGKELAARMIHDISLRAEAPYLVVNCAAIPSELFESEVFGHERGAFTGAMRRRKGLFEEAHGGTLFLDEIGDLSMANQARLLRAVETGTFRPVGGERDVHVDVRIVSATNRALPDTSQSYFRQDLFHRLAGVIVRIPPLRERPEDISVLAQHFLALAAPHAAAHPVGFSPDALEVLAEYHWPGNVRELRNVVERSCYTTASRHITAVDVQLALSPKRTISSTKARSLEQLERNHLVETLRSAGNNVGEAAKVLGIPRSTLYYKLARHGISVPRHR